MTENQSSSPAENPTEIALAEFLETTPPNATRSLNKDSLPAPVKSTSGKMLYQLRIPSIRLHCGHGHCGGVRTYRPSDDTHAVWFGIQNSFLRFTCGNCEETVKTFALRISARFDKNISLSKFGEYPQFGPLTPSRLVTMVGEDRELFLKGRRAEIAGLGIGAFGYYRRVVEQQKSRMLGEVIRVAETIGAPTPSIEALKAAQAENQFTKAMELARDAIPQSLFIKGRNPFNLLHSALSKALHEKSDETCLELASAIRVVLTEFSERLGQALKDEAELNAAVTRLMRVDQEPEADGK